LKRFVSLSRLPVIHGEHQRSATAAAITMSANAVTGRQSGVLRTFSLGYQKTQFKKLTPTQTERG